MKIVRIGSVELTEQEAERLYAEGRYIVTYSTVYKVIKTGDRIHGKTVHKAKGMTRRGRFYAMTAETLWNVFGIRTA